MVLVSIPNYLYSKNAAGPMTFGFSKGLVNSQREFKGNMESTAGHYTFIIIYLTSGNLTQPWKITNFQMILLLLPWPFSIANC